jgi:ribosomal protein S18 acetylase RimI-like enzyme
VQPVVRLAERSDAPAIAALYLEAAGDVVNREPTFRHVPDRSAVERRYAARAKEAEQTLLVAVVDQAVVGFADAVLNRHEDRGSYDAPGVDVYVEELIVTAHHRRRGIGTKLMDAVEAWAEARGARLVTLDTHVTNDAARALYGEMGYRDVGVILVKEL